jgi:hypothetical protein
VVEIAMRAANALATGVCSERAATRRQSKEKAFRTRGDAKSRRCAVSKKFAEFLVAYPRGTVCRALVRKAVENCIASRRLSSAVAVGTGFANSSGDRTQSFRGGGEGADSFAPHNSQVFG